MGEAGGWGNKASSGSRLHPHKHPIPARTNPESDFFQDLIPGQNWLPDPFTAETNSPTRLPLPARPPPGPMSRWPWSRAQAGTQVLANAAACAARSAIRRLRPRGGGSHSLWSWGPEAARPSDVRVRAGPPNPLPLWAGVFVAFKPPPLRCS